jgi:hypothetical protein
VIVARRLINHVWLENNLTVMAIKAVLPILFILVMGQGGADVEIRSGARLW